MYMYVCMYVCMYVLYSLYRFYTFLHLLRSETPNNYHQQLFCCDTTFSNFSNLSFNNLC